MKKKHFVSAALLVFLCASLYAQKDFYDMAAKGTTTQVLAALRAGANAAEEDRLGVTPLMAAAAGNPDPAVVGLLLAAGARIGGRDAMDDTPLMYAARSNPSVAVMRSLLEAGANLNERDFFGNTPLMIAAQFATNPEVISLLLRAGADTAPANTEGKTALALAGGNPCVRRAPAFEELAHARR
jgi:uncharacterized protein